MITQRTNATGTGTILYSSLLSVSSFHLSFPFPSLYYRSRPLLPTVGRATAPLARYVPAPPNKCRIMQTKLTYQKTENSHTETYLTVLSELSLLLRQNQRLTTGSKEQRFSHSLHQCSYCQHHSSGRFIKQEQWERWRAERKLLIGSSTGGRCGRGLSPPAVDVRGYHPWKF